MVYWASWLDRSRQHNGPVTNATEWGENRQRPNGKRSPGDRGRQLFEADVHHTDSIGKPNMGTGQV
jgi:hypothetical protein